MFTKQKRNYRVFIYTALVVTLCLLVAALLWPKEEAADNSMVNAQTRAEEDGEKDASAPAEDDEGSDKDDISTSGDKQDGEKSDITASGESYYVVRKDGSQISVYFSDGEGNEVKLETTEILYDLLPPDDQKSFEKGIKVMTQEELAALLQDFES